MDNGKSHEITVALRAAVAGEPRAADDLLPLVYDELRALARSRLRRLSPGQTLQPTALVHEAYLKVVGAADPTWEGRAHFFGAAANAMRQIIVDQARRKASLKHGGGRGREDLDHASPLAMPPPEDVMAIDEAIDALAAHAPRRAELVKLRFFAGFTMEEAARALGISIGTAERDWRYANSWLHDRLSHADDEDAGA